MLNCLSVLCRAPAPAQHGQKKVQEASPGMTTHCIPDSIQHGTCIKNHNVLNAKENTENDQSPFRRARSRSDTSGKFARLSLWESDTSSLSEPEITIQVRRLKGGVRPLGQGFRVFSFFFFFLLLPFPVLGCPQNLIFWQLNCCTISCNISLRIFLSRLGSNIGGLFFFSPPLSTSHSSKNKYLHSGSKSKVTRVTVGRDANQPKFSRLSS